MQPPHPASVDTSLCNFTKSLNCVYLYALNLACVLHNYFVVAMYITYGLCYVCSLGQDIVSQGMAQVNIIKSIKEVNIIKLLAILLILYSPIAYTILQTELSEHIRPGGNLPIHCSLHEQLKIGYILIQSEVQCMHVFDTLTKICSCKKVACSYN